MMADSTSDDENWIKKNWVILVAFLVMACVIGFYFFQFSPYNLSKDLCINTTGDEADCLSKDAARWGTFGDFFGGTLNPILSFLALIIVLKTYLSQQEELKETRKILKEQSETQKRQQFESTFFELLKVHNQELEVFCKSEPYIEDGRTHWANPLARQLVQDIKRNELRTLKDAKNILQSKNHLCRRYFLVLYQLLKFIAIHSNNGITESFDDSDIEKDDISANEKMYSNIIRATLTDMVVLLLLVNCYSNEKDTGNYWKYKLLVERYSFFEHAAFLDEHNKYNEWVYFLTEATGFENQEGFYKPKAFGK